jgi:hypothetical protein
MAAPPSRYRVVNGCLSRIRRDHLGAEISDPLAAFDARIEEELLYDDGVATSMMFLVSGRSQDGRELRPLRVPAPEFGGMAWVAKGWGTAGVIEAGARDHLRAAILKLSVPRQRRIFRRTGWVEVGKEWVFLAAGSAVGGAGVEVELEPPLDRFRLPQVPEDLPDAVRASLSLLDCAPATLMVPLLGAVYLAPLAFILRPDFGVFAFGETGSLKSELGSLAQAHYGDFDRKSLPVSWASTTAAIESRLASLADVLVCIDDFAPQANVGADRELQQRAERIIRSIGNQAARGRVRGDLTYQPDRAPRGLVLATGERLPQGHSINARLVAVEVDRSRLDLGAVTNLQGRRHRLPHALRGYLDWIRARIPDLRASLPGRRDELRTTFQCADGHLRHADALASLHLGIELLAAFAENAGAVAHEAAEALQARAREALLAIGGHQAVTLARADPAERFVGALSGLLAEGRVCLEPVCGVVAPSAETAIGYRTLTSALVLPEAAYREVALHLRERGEHWAPVASQLHAALVRKGYVIPDAEGRAISQHRVGQARRPRVLNIPLAVLMTDQGPAGAPGLQQPSQPSVRPDAGTVAGIHARD